MVQDARKRWKFDITSITSVTESINDQVGTLINQAGKWTSTKIWTIPEPGNDGPIMVRNQEYFEGFLSLSMNKAGEFV